MEAITTNKPEMDSAIPAYWKSGLVKVFSDRGIAAAFLYEDETGAKYDLPQFCTKFAYSKCKLLCREYEKQVGEKTYKKLIVISIKRI